MSAFCSLQSTQVQCTLISFDVIVIVMVEFLKELCHSTFAVFWSKQYRISPFLQSVTAEAKKLVIILGSPLI